MPFGMESYNYSIFATPVLWIISSIPHIYSMQITPMFDLRQPRSMLPDLLESKTVDEDTKTLIIRLQGAHQNGFENIAFFGCAIIVGNIAGLPNRALNTLAFLYLLSRILYTAFYLINDTREKAQIRMGLFFVGIGLIFKTYIQAGIAIMYKGVVLPPSVVSGDVEGLRAHLSNVTEAITQVATFTSSNTYRWLCLALLSLSLGVFSGFAGHSKITYGLVASMMIGDVANRSGTGFLGLCMALVISISTVYAIRWILPEPFKEVLPMVMEGESPQKQTEGE